jgi:hypothetical protein
MISIDNRKYIMDQSCDYSNYACDPPNSSWNGSCNLPTEELIQEYIKHYTKESNDLYVSEQISQFIRMYIRDKLDNKEIVSFSPAGLFVVRSNYHSDLKKILGNLDKMPNLLINVYVNELYIDTQKKMSKELIKQFVEKDTETIDIINQFIQNYINDTDIYVKLLSALSNVRLSHIKNIENL